MTLTSIFTRMEKLVADNSTTILTAIGVTGTITTAYLTGKATFKAAYLINQEEVIEGTHDEALGRFKERFALTWKLYIPAAGTGLITVISIITAHRIGSRRAAALASAFSVSEKAWSEYKDKVVEKIGESKEQRIRDEIAQDQITRNPVSKTEVIITSTGDVLCYDSITGRYFQSNVETLRASQNTINKQILEEMYASLYEFYELIGLPRTDYSTEVGWNADNLLDLKFSTALAEDGRPCISVLYSIYPIRDYHRLN